ncbi:MAG: hypothetical protein ABSH09_06025 [Bryobacteraceae bacterium]
MQCLHCGVPLAIMRTLASGEFCSDEHRQIYEDDRGLPQSTELFPILKPRLRRVREALRAKLEPARLDVLVHAVHQTVRLKVQVPGPAGSRKSGKPWSPLPRKQTTGRKPGGERLIAVQPLPAGPSGPTVEKPEDTWAPPGAGRVSMCFEVSVRFGPAKRTARTSITPIGSTAAPMIPHLDIHPKLKPLAKPRIQQTPRTLRAQAAVDHSSIDLSSQRLREIWKNSPGDLKLIAMVIPMILLLTLNAAGPRLYSKPVAIKATAQPMIDGMLTRQWHAFRKSIAERAGFEYSDDFRAGLDAWTSGKESNIKWSYDSMGFVKPGDLAIFKPTLQAADYEVDFEGNVEQRALGFVFRATDANNYEAVKFLITKTGPFPEMLIVRYAVINGREGPKKETPVPATFGRETFFDVHMSVRGNDFTLMVQNKVADCWSDGRLRTGGIGFFCGKGESARVHRVDVTHQNDTLGRFCAYIASEGSDSTNGS